MGYRDEIDIDKLNEREKDLINLIDRNIATGLEDIKNGRVISLEEARKFLLNNINKTTIFSKNEKIGVTI